jgi:enoyl-CoA hydratase/carnithine racemase
VAYVRIDHPPVNLLDAALIRDLDLFHTEVSGDDTVRVVVFESADPEFFLAHGEMRLMTDPDRLDEYLSGPGLTLFQRYREPPQVTIGKVTGRARGAGNEFLLGLDMRFAAAGRAWFGQPEVSLGILPGGGGTQLLPRMIGRARALEVVLGADLFDAETAQRYGWINRALPADELDDYVSRLATRIAAQPVEAVAKARRAIDAAQLPLDEGSRSKGSCSWPCWVVRSRASGSARHSRRAHRPAPASSIWRHC